VGGFTWSMTCPVVRATSTSGPTLCFLMGARGPRGFVENDMDNAMEKAAHLALTALCLQRLPDTAGTPISLYPV
jgi:hypothetical protein